MTIRHDAPADLPALIEAFIAVTTEHDPIRRLARIAAIRRFYDERAPKTLFKYFPDKTRRIETLRNNELWLAAPETFNDVFDCLLSVDSEQILKDLRRQADEKRLPGENSRVRVKAQELAAKGIGEMRSTFENVRQTFGVACFCERCDSSLMWAHYANFHRGFCAEYDLKSVTRHPLMLPVPVLYAEDRALLTRLDIDRVRPEAIAYFIRSLVTKSAEWSYEREWRIVRDRRTCDKTWDDKKHGVSLDFPTPVSVTLGVSADDDFTRQMRVYCEEAGVALYRMTIDPLRYRLNRERAL